MADYIYLLEHRLSAAQRDALSAVRSLARDRGLTLFLVGGAVRDLTSGSPVRDLDVVVLGNALKLKKELEKAGALIEGEYEPLQSLYVRFSGQVRMEIGSALAITYPKPGKPVARPATILEDLRRRDFTANAMALSLNEGSYGLLMDPLNGVADIENRELRLVSNYGFVEEPVRMIRAARMMARLGWTLEERTQTRYQNAIQEGYLSGLSDFQAGYEVEEIFHEEDPLRVLKRLESEGWMKFLAPFWNSSKANVQELERLREAQTQLQMHGIFPDPSAANFPLLTARLSAKEVASLKEMFPRQGFVAEIDGVEGDAKELAAQLSGKQSALASQSWRLLNSSRPETVMQLLFTSKNAALQSKLKSFLTDWPQARQKVPVALMQEMRITPDLPGYAELIESLFFELMDGRLGTPEEMKAFLEPHSPPAPPPPLNVRRPRQTKAVARPAKSRSRKAKADTEEGEELDLPDDQEDSSMPDAGEDVDAIDLLADAMEDETLDDDVNTEDDADDVEDPDESAEQDQVINGRSAGKQPAEKIAAKKSSSIVAALSVVSGKKRQESSPAGKTVPTKTAGSKAIAGAEKVAVNEKAVTPPVGKSAAKSSVSSSRSTIAVAPKTAVSEKESKTAGKAKAGAQPNTVKAAKEVATPAKKMANKSVSVKAAGRSKS